jgi:acetylornithine/succinyldiaminopimelate/putrescine aminotransferase
MESLKDQFLKNLGQTSRIPFGIEVDKAVGSKIFTPDGKDYFDLLSGFSVNNIGHGNPKVISAVQEQAAKYMHTMVYGELVQSPQVKYAGLLISKLPKSLNKVFFVNSGSEAIEGALKLAKRITGRTEMVSFTNSYHGSSHGALSMMGSEKYKTWFRPLLPDVRMLDFNSFEQLDQISERTAAVLIEPIQSEAGIIEPKNDFLKALRQKCTDTGAQLIFDEIQTGMGRTGKLFAMEHYDVVPDILALAKALGGGMPLGAFISSHETMESLIKEPGLGHLTTCGGHPVSCAAGMAALNVILDDDLLKKSEEKGQKFRSLMKHPSIKEIRGKGLFIALKLQSAEQNFRLFKRAKDHGFITDLFLFNEDSFRIAPPLSISDEDIIELSGRILKALDNSLKVT